MKAGGTNRFTISNSDDGQSIVEISYDLGSERSALLIAVTASCPPADGLLEIQAAVAERAGKALSEWAKKIRPQSTA